MAVAGLHNLSAFGPSLFGESQAPVSRQWGDEANRPIPQSPSLLQMWHEIEGDSEVSVSHRSRAQRNGTDSEGLSISISLGQRGDIEHDLSEDVAGSDMDHSDNNSVVSEQSSDLGEIERERVRQLFREWNSSGAKGHSSNHQPDPNDRVGPQLLGENECKRVIARCDIGLRRPIRRLCGRQTLLDLLLRFQCERKGELQCLLEQRPVSDFAHRNRIQAFLRGRFLRNERLMQDKRPSSVASTELGLLRRRHTVSGLREGFLSKLDNSASTSGDNSAESDSLVVDVNNGELDSTCNELEATGILTSSNLEHAVIQEVTQMEDTVSHEENEQQVNEQEVSSEMDDSHQELSHDVESAHSRDEQVSDCVEQQENEQAVSLENDDSHQELSHDVESAHSRDEQVSDNDEQQENEQEVSSEIDDGHQELSRDVESSRSRDEQVSDSEITEQESSSTHGEVLNANITNGSTLETEDTNDSGGPLQEVFHEHYVDEVAVHTADMESNINERLDRRDDSAQVDEFHQESVTAVEDSQHDNLQEAIDSWLDFPSEEAGASITGPTFYFPDEDSAHGTEIRELFSRGRVSSLLRSSFRESLDQVLQSRVGRQGQGRDSGEWEIDNTSSSHHSLVDQDQGQNGHSLSPTSNLVAGSHPIWDEYEGPNSTRNSSSHQLGMEWEVVNQLRNDMARLQQRMNNMQCMLEQCIDIQIELQRSVRQEVSAALNRPISTIDNTLHHDEAQWDYARRGICCLCRDDSIDSLLYRCGHMCTCSNCAEKLVGGSGKCPMCQAPVVEVVRAYFIQ